MPSSEHKWKSGDLVQLRRHVQGEGDIGVVIGPTKEPRDSGGCIDVLYHNGIRMTHPTNLQRPRRGMRNEDER